MTAPLWTSPPWLGVTILSMVAALLLLLSYLAYKIWKLRHRLEALCAAMEEDREVATGILKTIKGWVVVNVARDTAHVEEVKKLIEPLPEQAATKVMEKIEEKRIVDAGNSHDSGTLPVV